MCILEMRTIGASPMKWAIKCLIWRVMPYCYCDGCYQWLNSLINDDDDDCWVGGLILFKQCGRWLTLMVKGHSTLLEKLLGRKVLFFAIGQNKSFFTNGGGKIPLIVFIFYLLLGSYFLWNKLKF